MDMAIPDYVQQNLASIQSDLVRGWQTTMSGQPAGGQGFDGFLNNAVARARDLAAPPMPGMQEGFIPLDTGVAGASPGLQAFMAGLQQGGAAPVLQSQSNSVIAGLPASGRAESVPLMPGFQTYKSQVPQGDARSAIADAAYFDGNAMTPAQIDKYLADKHSPFAGQQYDGKSAGQLIWETCQNTGDAKGAGPHKLNPAIMVAIMGAETSFGRDGHWAKTNPFSVKGNGSFDNVRDFPTSLRLATKTMYNWAQDRPATSSETLFDYAGRHYCEDYQVEWKPNVEKFYRQALGFGGENQA